MCIRKILCAALCALLLTGCAQAGPAFIPHGYLADESVAQVGGAFYAFLPKTGEAGPRTYLCELRQGQAPRPVCNRADCAHMEQSTLADPCNAYAPAGRGLLAAGDALYAGDGGRILRYDPAGGAPEVVLSTEGTLRCFLMLEESIVYSLQGAEGFGFYRVPRGQPEEAPTALYEQDGQGYIGCAQEIDGWLYLTEVRLNQGGQMDLVRVRPDGSACETYAENAGGHCLVPLEGGLAAVRQGETGYEVVLLEESGQAVRTLCTTETRPLLCPAGDGLLVDEGLAFPAAERALWRYESSGELVGTVTVPAACGAPLGADAETAYYWESTDEGPRLVQVRLP
ncbi:MAG: hypothetical protein ACOX83_00450 [Candidatus Spyradocola sp.]|jgi:hypothetical protein